MASHQRQDDEAEKAAGLGHPVPRDFTGEKARSKVSASPSVFTICTPPWRA
ncbi:MAG: hypothetical protein R3D85_04965 [Paracoccaceae bacterium]